jgi:hypothetical protein
MHRLFVLRIEISNHPATVRLLRAFDSWLGRGGLRCLVALHHSFSHSFDFRSENNASKEVFQKKNPKMFKMTMAKFLRPAVATPTKTHDEKIVTLSEAQTKQIRQQNLRTLNSFINTNMGTPIDQRCKKQMRFAYSEIPARFEVPSDNCEMLCITCVLLTLDSFDRPAMLRRKCRRMNAKISGAVVRMND